METLVVGDDGCKISEIVNTIGMSPASSKLGKIFSNIALALQRPINEREEMARSISMKMITASEALTLILLRWREDLPPREATLLNFISILKEQKLDDFAFRLRKKFGIEDDSSILDGPCKNTRSRNNKKSGKRKGRTSNRQYTLSESDNWTSQVEELPSKEDQKEAEIQRQKDYITNNLPHLIDSLSYTPMLIALFQSERILNSDQAADMSAISSPAKKVCALFDFIKARLNPGEPELYEKVIAIFERERQGGVVYILKQILPQ